MQLQWIQETLPVIEQLREWSHQYVVYNGAYEILFPADSDSADMDNKITMLWSETLPQLLLAPNEKEFDRIWKRFLGKRETMGYQKLLEESTIYMNEAKKKLEIE